MTRHPLLSEASQRIAVVLERASRKGPPTPPTALERALLRRDMRLTPEERERRLLEQIDRGWPCS